MSLFDAFTPERLIKAMGIDPAQLVQFMQSVTGEVAGFKGAFQGVVAHFNGKLSSQDARLARIEAQQLRILQLLGEQDFPHVTPPAIANGHDASPEADT